MDLALVFNASDENTKHKRTKKRMGEGTGIAEMDDVHIMRCHVHLLLHWCLDVRVLTPSEKSLG